MAFPRIIFSTGCRLFHLRLVCDAKLNLLTMEKKCSLQHCYRPCVPESTIARRVYKVSAIDERIIAKFEKEASL